MRSATEARAADKNLGRRCLDTFEIWNRRLHYYLGLYLLFFLWLFAFTGLLLNHPAWTFQEFWPMRKQSTDVRQVQPPPAGGDLVQARNILRQLGISGEIEWTTTRKDPAHFDFRASRPGHIFEIKADFQQNQATIQRIDLNGWGVIHILHTFTGVRLGDTRNDRDWMLTSLWALSMDAVAVGLIVMVLSSFYMWYGWKSKRRLGAVVLLLGSLLCGLFVAGLRWMY